MKQKQIIIGIAAIALLFGIIMYFKNKQPRLKILKVDNANKKIDFQWGSLKDTFTRGEQGQNEWLVCGKNMWRVPQDSHGLTAQFYDKCVLQDGTNYGLLIRDNGDVVTFSKLHEAAVSEVPTEVKL